MSRSLRALIARDLRAARRQGMDSALTLGFFLLVATVFAFGLGAALPRSADFAPGILWVAALLALLLSLDRLFQADYDDGSLEQLLLSDMPPLAIVAAKCVAHWLTTALPLILLSPLLALMLRMPAAELGWTALGLLLGTPTLTLIGAAGAALVLGARRGGPLLVVLVLPLYVPVLIFGASAAGGDNRAPLLFLGALLLAALVLAPLAAAAALRQAME